MSKLTDFLHKLIDQVGASSLHPEVDALEEKETTATPADETKGEEETPNAAE